MSRKPIDKQQPSECRQAVWEWIRAWGSAGFTICDIAFDVRLQESSIRDYLRGLFRAGYLERDPMGPGGPITRMTPIGYRLLRDTGVDAPRVRRDGTPVTQGIGRLHMWNAMQVLKSFSAVDLAFTASTPEHKVAEGEALRYCQALCLAGYLVKRTDGKYSLIAAMWTGPHPPQIQRTKQVYDPNLRRVVWARVEGGAE